MPPQNIFVTHWILVYPSWSYSGQNFRLCRSMMDLECNVDISLSIMELQWPEFSIM